MCRRPAERALQTFLLARQSGGAARTGAAPHRPAGGRADGGLYARPCHRRALGGRRARAGLHQRAPVRGRAGAARRGGWPTGCGRLDRAVCRRPAACDAERSRQGPRRRDAAAGRAPGRRGGDGAGPRNAEGDPGICPRQQYHPYPDRQGGALALVRAAARFGGARPDARQRRHQRHRRLAAKARPSRPRASRPRAAARRGCLARLCLQRWRRRRHRAALRWSMRAVFARRWAASACCSWWRCWPARCPSGCGPPCSPRCSACWPIISSSCRRSTPSPSPIRTTGCPSACCCSWRSSPAIWRRGCAPRPIWRPARAGDAGELYRFTGKLAGIATLDDLLWATAFQIASMLECNVVILLPSRDDEAAGGARRLSAGRRAGRRRSGRRHLGLGAGPGRGAQRRHLAGRAAAVPADAHRRGDWSASLGLQRPDDKHPVHAGRAAAAGFAASTRRRWRSSGPQLVEQVDEAQVLAETDKLRVAMLTSLQP